MKPGVRDGDEWRGQGHAEQHQGGGCRHEQPEDGAGKAPGLAGAPVVEQAAVDGDERRRDRALAQQILEQVWSSERGFEDVGMGADAEEGGCGGLAYQAQEAATKDAGGDGPGVAVERGRARIGGREAPRAHGDPILVTRWPFTRRTLA